MGRFVEWLRHLGLRTLINVSERVLITFWSQDRGGYVSGDGRVGEDLENTGNFLVKNFVPTTPRYRASTTMNENWGLARFGTCM